MSRPPGERVDTASPYRRAALWLAVPLSLVLTTFTWATNRGRPVLGVEGGALVELAWLSFAGVVVGLVLVGVLIVARARGNGYGWVLILTGGVFGLSGALAGYAYVTLVGGWPLPAGAIANWATRWLDVLGAILIGFVFLLFPDGRLPSHRWRWPVRAYVAAGAVYLVGAAADSWLRRAHILPDVADSVPYLGEGAVARLWAAFMLLSLVPVVALVDRYVGGGAEERAQVRWLASAGVVTVAAQLVMQVVGTSLLVAVVAAALTVTWPVAIAVAILRYRLYDIDRLISRTVTYALVVTMLVLVYVTGVVGLGTVLSAATGREGSDLLVAASTLAAVALVRPVRSRVQLAVDRHFNRTGYLARRTVDSFPARVRDEVDLDTIRQAVARTAIDAVQPASLSLALLAPEGGPSEPRP
jgi:hypothetical protein